MLTLALSRHATILYNETELSKINMHDNVFTELAIIIAIGAGISLLMRVIRQPLIIGYILTGLVVGPALLNVIDKNDTIEVFSEIGVALLLFIIGLGLNPRVVKEVGKVSLITSMAQMAFTTSVGYIVGQALGYTRTESIIIGLGLGFSSTIIILKLLNDKKEQNRLYGKIAIGMLLIEDIVATLALVFVTARSNGSFSTVALSWLGLKAFLLAVPIYLIGSYVLPRYTKLIAGSQEFLFLFAIGWGFGIAALFEALGFSIEIGALFAGVALATLPYSQEIASRLRPLRDFFVIVFFIALGTRLSFDDLGIVLIPAIVLSVVVITAKPLITMALLGLQSYTKSTSFKTGSALSQISEFSLVLVILGAQQGIVREELVGVMTLVALITITVTSYAIVYNNQLYALFERNMMLFERRKTHPEQQPKHHYDMILFGYNKGGREFVKMMEQLKKRFIVVDYDPDVIDILDRKAIPYIYGDATDMELLQEINLSNTKLVISTMSDHETNLFLAKYIEDMTPHTVFICAADGASQASELYEKGADYVMLPHYVGSEKISSFIRRNGFNKSDFRAYREKHLQYLETHYT